jgi:hypothetical protein
VSTVSPLENLHRQQSLIKDRIRAVVHREANGVYLHGRPGSSKTYLVRTTLDSLDQRYGYSNGHLTPVGLFDLLKENPQSVIVLDDVSAIFEQPKALQILLAALGTPHDGSRIRTIRYKTATVDEEVLFEGSIVAISNLQLAGHANAVLEALQDRVHVMAFEPTDEEVEAAIYEIAGTSPRGVAVYEAAAVADFLLEQCRGMGLRPSVRLFMDKALPDYRLWRAGNTESDWHDLVRSSVRQMVIPQQRGLRDLTRKDQIASERNIVRDICVTYYSRKDRLKAWRAKTRKGQSAFYRRFKELEKEARLSAMNEGRAGNSSRKEAAMLK